MLHELEYRLLLCYMGQTRQSAKIIDRQTQVVSRGRKETVHALDALKPQTLEMKQALLLGHVDELRRAAAPGVGAQEAARRGHLERAAWTSSTSMARREGAIGGKMTGAGGGGYFLFLTRFDRRHRVAAALEKHGGQVVPFQFEPRGVQTWSVARAR